MKAKADIFRGLYGIAGPHSGNRLTRRQETLDLAAALLSAGVRVLQLRDKDSDGRALLEVARLLRAMTREAQALFVVNDRLDIALMADADGVHVGQDDLPVADVRRVAAQVGRSDLVVGLSTHDLEQVRAATALPVDYIGFGPVFATTSKSDALPSRGVGLLAEAVALAGAMPVVAIGGVGLTTAPEVHRTGVAMAAVIGDIVNSPDPASRAATIHATLL